MSTDLKSQPMKSIQPILIFINNFQFDGDMNASQRRSIKEIIAYWMTNYPYQDLKCLAYILATADFETDRKFLPIEDKLKGKGFDYGLMVKQNGEYYLAPIQLYYRRGIVPLLWYENYKSISSKLDVNILQNPDLVMDKSISLKILVDGMMQGWFTGYRLEKFLNQTKLQWEDARRVIIKSEKNQLIKSLAKKYYTSLRILE